MAQAIETAKQYSIPVTDITDIHQSWEQTCEIPVIQTELRVSPFTFIYLRFLMDPERPSGLAILAGGTDLETVARRIRVQMIHHLEIAENDLQQPEPPLTSNLEFQRISQYFSPCNKNSGG